MDKIVRSWREWLCIEVQCYDHVSRDPFFSETLFKCKCFPHTLINPCLFTRKGFKMDWMYLLFAYATSEWIDTPVYNALPRRDWSGSLDNRVLKWKALFHSSCQRHFSVWQGISCALQLLAVSVAVLLHNLNQRYACLLYFRGYGA